MEAVKHYGRNTAGRDLIVGDIHGCFDQLADALVRIGFNTKRDRLFAVGDLIDRGPHSIQALGWLREPWFHAVQGNHEQMATIYATHGYLPGYEQHGGKWFMDLDDERRQLFVEAFAKLPLVIELETEFGIVGIVHAACDYPTWSEFVQKIESGDEAALDNAVWGRKRWGTHSIGTEPVRGVNAVVVGHTIHREITTDHNVVCIDTGAFLPRGHITVINASNLLPATRNYT